MGSPSPNFCLLLLLPHSWHSYGHSYLAHVSSSTPVCSVFHNPQFLLHDRQSPSPWFQAISHWPSRAHFCKSAYTLWAFSWDKALAQLAMAEGGTERDLATLANCLADAAGGPCSPAGMGGRAMIDIPPTGKGLNQLHKGEAPAPKTRRRRPGPHGTVSHVLSEHMACSGPLN